MTLRRLPSFSNLKVFNMSKVTKFLRSPKKFIADARSNSAIRRLRNMSPEERERLGASETSRATTKPNSSSNLVKTKPEIARPKDLTLSRKLLEFERTFPVNGLSYSSDKSASDLLLWPFFRHLFWVRCQAAYKGNNTAQVNTSKFYISREWRRHYERQSLETKTIETIPEAHYDFLFFTNLRGTEQTRINGQIFNRITDPVFEIAQTLGSAIKVEVIKSTGEIWPHRVHEADLILPPLHRRIGHVPFTERPSNFVDAVNKILPEIKFDERSYVETVEWFFHQIDFYTELLKKYNPKNVFFVGFDYHLALICAAKSLGIHTVDLQHGVQSGWSPVYNLWQAVPRQGYTMLPDTFWVWGSYDAAKIRDTFGSDPNVCGTRALVGGFPWLDRQQTLIDEKIPEKLQKVLSKIAMSRLAQEEDDSIIKKIGLLTLQDQTVLPQLFIDIIKKTSDEIEWVVKRHPKHQRIDLSSVQQVALFGKAFDSVCFHTLVRAADIHLTECSTSVIEADYFGVPSVVTGEQGTLNYKDFIEDGSVYHVGTAEEFIEHLDFILASAEKGRMKVIENSNVQCSLRILMEKTND